MKGAGGTTGGVGMFFSGAALVVAGAYLLLTRVSVVSGGWLFYGYKRIVQAYLLQAMNP